MFSSFVCCPALPNKATSSLSRVIVYCIHTYKSSSSANKTGVHATTSAAVLLMGVAWSDEERSKQLTSFSRMTITSGLSENRQGFCTRGLAAGEVG
jgi:hypothetical protein